MGKFKFSKESQNIANVLKFTQNRITELQNNSEKKTRSINEEEPLISTNHTTPMELNLAKHASSNNSTITVPSWENLCKAAKCSIGNNCTPESLFTADEIKSINADIKRLNKQYNHLNKLDFSDYAICCFVGLMSAVADIFYVGKLSKTKDGLEGGKLSNLIRNGFDNHFTQEIINKLEKNNTVPYDAQNNKNTSKHIKGLSPYYHRLHTFGHDPFLGFIIGVIDIIYGTMTTIDRDGNIISQKMDCYSDRIEKNIIKAIFKEFRHLKSDVNTSMGLPAPLMIIFNLFQFGSIGEEEQTIAEIVQGMYFEGYDFIHFCSMSIPVLISDIMVRLLYSLKRLKKGYSLKESMPFSIKHSSPTLNSMLFVTHLTSTAINAGKIYFTKDPLSINYPQWIIFFKQLFIQLKQILIKSPYLRYNYVTDNINKDALSTYKNIDEIFETLTRNYTVFFE